MCLTLLSSLACPDLPYFSSLSHKRYDFRGGGMVEFNIKRVFRLSLQILCETFLILIRLKRDITINIHTYS
jgi:hypothetical protein